MAFTKESASKAGKISKRGKDSRVSTIRNIYSDFLENNSNKIQELFDEVASDDPAKALDFILKLSAYIVPKPKPTDEDKGETDYSKVPAWLRPKPNFEEMSDEEFKKQLEKANKVIEAANW